MKKFLAGAGTGLIFSGNNLIAVGKTYSETSLGFSVTAEEIRAGKGDVALYVE